MNCFRSLFIAMIFTAAASFAEPTSQPVAIVEVIPTSEHVAATWRYTVQRPRAEWKAVGFDDSGWQESPAPFGAGNTPGITPRTEWNTADIWLRRQITVPENITAADLDRLQFMM